MHLPELKQMCWGCWMVMRTLGTDLSWPEKNWKHEDKQNTPVIGPDESDELGGKTAAPNGLQSDPECLDGEGNDDNDKTSTVVSHQVSYWVR